MNILPTGNAPAGSNYYFFILLFNCIYQMDYLYVVFICIISKTKYKKVLRLYDSF